LHGGVVAFGFLADHAEFWLGADSETFESRIVWDFGGDGREVELGPGFIIGTPEHDIHGEAFVVAVEMLAGEAFGLAGSFVPRFEKVELRTLAGLEALFEYCNQSIEPLDVLLGDGCEPIIQSGLEKVFCEIDTTELELVFGVGSGDIGFGLGNFARGLRLSEEGKFLFDAVNEVAFIRPHGLASRDPAEANHWICPGADSVGVLDGSFGAGIGGLDRRMIGSQTFGEEADVLSREYNAVGRRRQDPCGTGSPRRE
jgi:hypothetical protein